MTDHMSNLPLTVGISTRAMFDLVEEHSVFERDGVHAYAELQRAREKEPLKPGAAFEVTRRLLALNSVQQEPLVEVILLSKNSPDLSLRAFNSFDHYCLPIRRGSFTSGRSVAPFVKAWNVDLFLSNDADDVKAAVLAGTAAARLGPLPSNVDENPSDEVRIALDGDAVVFSEASDKLYNEHGLEHFLQYERDNATVPMERGPFGKTFLPKLAALRQKFMRPDGTSRVRIAIVTARNAPAHERVIHTLRAWGTPADEAHFVGRHEKAPILKATRAHIFFDDQEKHILGASEVVAAGLVPGPHDPGVPVIPA
ncbi:5'-nucleotidase [Mesorhizobium sp. WSM3866]|uniref:5'-nucleotidase n=1 Tax=Mesorhizobium sp. WSM3866 TaxID=422271 RepID=UPI000BB097FA|nr:5'-nucleotidase [Mesorhizobium sp. WSM3866]PBB45541.1 5'-nucleotidase [Mesorhizobium sp. WSM3866]